MKRDQGKKIILEQLRKVPLIEAAVGKAGVSRMTFYRWQRDDPEFAREVNEALLGGKELISDIAEGQLINAIKQGQISALTFWLRHHRADYKAKLEISGELRTIREELTPEELELLKEALKLAGFSDGTINQQQ